MLELFAYLGENGIRDIALMDDLRFPQKPQAYRFACGRYGITPRCYDFQYGDLASEEACIDRVAAERPELVIVGSDYVAAMTVSRLGRQGLRVPEEISVVTIDGPRWAEFYDPPLTAIRQDGRLLARAGIEELFRKLDGGAEPRTVMIPTSFQAGASVRTLPIHP